MCDTGRKPGSDLALNNLWLQVVDDGRGLGREELKVVGRLHWSGSAGRGRYLAALRRVVKVPFNPQGEVIELSWPTLSK